MKKETLTDQLTKDKKLFEYTGGPNKPTVGDDDDQPKKPLIDIDNIKSQAESDLALEQYFQRKRNTNLSDITAKNKLRSDLYKIVNWNHL